MRVLALDLIRGIDIIPMILFNYSVTLDYFRIVTIPSSFLYWFVFPRIIAAIFIFVSGVAAYLSYKKSKKSFGKRYFIRGLKLLLFAALITVFTYFFVPNGMILFGILHFFAISSFVVPFLINKRKFNLIAGTLIVLFGIYLQFATFNFSSLLWLGFMSQNYFAFDYFPVLPWIGVMMLGIYFSKNVAKKLQKINVRNKFSSFVSFLGRHSLEIYLIHQPLLIFLLTLMGYRLFF
jgi:uncharacterized membrane protein